MSEKKEVGYLFQMSAVLADGVNLMISGNFEKDAANSVMNAEVDRIRDVFMRQRAKNEVELIEAQVNDRKRRLEGMKFDLAQHEARGSQKKLDLEGAARMRRSIEDAELDIQEGEKKLAQTRELAK